MNGRELEQRARGIARWVTTDAGATWALRAMLPVTLVAFYVVGRHQWFTRDDWGYVLTMEGVLKHDGWWAWFNRPQEGHWLGIPIAIFHFTQELFGLDSYWPFLIPAMAAHVGAVFLTRAICRRLHVSAWTTTLICSMLLVFGSGWDNIVFAIQICYNISLVCFLGQLLLVDHDGPTDRRDVCASVLGVIGVMSSGFGPIFACGVFALLALRRRWKALLVTIVPQALVYSWWYVAWFDGGGAARLPGDRVQLPAYAARGITATFESFVVVPALAGIALVATLAVALWRGMEWSPRTLMISMWSVLAVMFVAIGWERIGFGVPTAASSRYVHMAAIVIAPAFGLAVDRLAGVAAEARWAGRIVLAAAVAVNAGALRTNAAGWAEGAQDEKRLLELLAGSPETSTVSPFTAPLPLSPNVTLAHLPELVAQGALQPRQPTTDREQQEVRDALGLP